jgi:hypothetical protein
MREWKVFLPLPLGEGWGEGLRRSRVISFAPLPRPFFQREKGEMIEWQTQYEK